jgi:hypothetical protein
VKLNEIIIKNGLYFGWVSVLFSSAFLYYSFMIFLPESLIMKTFAFLIILFSFGTFRGVQINLSKGVTRHYINFLGVKTGKWHSLKLYNRVSIVKERKRERVGNKFRRTVTLDFVITSYNIVLINKSHRKKMVLKNFSSFEKAKIQAEKLAKQTELPLVKYAPKRLKNSTRR